MTLRVVHLLGSLRASGMERMLQSGAEHFRAAGITASIIGQGDDHPFRPELTEAGYAIQSIRPIRTPSGWSDLRQALIAAAPDVVHVHTESAFAAAVLLARSLSSRPPVVRTIHNVFDPQEARARASRWIQSRLTDHRVAVFAAPTEEVSRNEARLGRKVQVVANWIDDSYMPAQDIVRQPRTAVLVGNCSVIKNHELALRAAASQGYSIYHVGDETHATGAERDLLAMLDAAGRLLHRGPGDPLEALQRAQVYLMPSLHEGMGVALAEALACGTPSLVSAAPGLMWAEDLPGVTHLPLDTGAWEQHLATPPHASSPPPSATAYSAARGVREYVGIYRAALGRMPDQAHSSGRPR